MKNKKASIAEYVLEQHGVKCERCEVERGRRSRSAIDAIVRDLKAENIRADNGVTP